MARYLFGGTVFDFVDSSVKVQNIDILAPTAATVTLWTAQTGGSQITDLLDSSSSPISVVTVESDGNIPPFYGPDGVTSMYASANGGPRLAIVSWHAAANAVSSAETAATNAGTSATNAASSAAAAEQAAASVPATTDAAMAPLVAASSGSATSAALNAAYAGRQVGTIDDLETPFGLPHRSGGNIYPENTLEGWRAVLATGSLWVDVDLGLLADGGLVAMHDATVDRTTTGTGNVSSFSTAAIQRITVDASSWFGYGAADSKPVLFPQLLTEFGNKVLMQVEPKTSDAVAPVLDALDAAGIDPATVMLNTFGLGWLQPAVDRGYPVVMWNTDDGTTDPADILALGVGWVGVNFPISSQARVQALKAAGLRVMAWNISNRNDRDTAISWGVDCWQSDEWGYVNRDDQIMSSDGFALQTRLPGMIPFNGTLAFAAGGQMGFTSAAPGNWRGWLMGHMSPIPNADSIYTITATCQMNSATSDDRFSGIMFSAVNDQPFTNASKAAVNGYNAIIRKNGDIGLYRVTDGAAILLAQNTSGTAIPDGGTATVKITVTPSSVTFERTDVAYSCTKSDMTYRGGYFHLGMQGVVGTWKAVVLGLI